MRKRLSLTQTDVSLRCGNLSQNHLSAIESGRHIPSLRSLESIARALETTPAALLTPMPAGWNSLDD
jgi:transcriptional regulator with XRE-family HTH domain